jgi:hypothetical protein
LTAIHYAELEPLEGPPVLGGWAKNLHSIAGVPPRMHCAQ